MLIARAHIAHHQEPAGTRLPGASIVRLAAASCDSPSPSSGHRHIEPRRSNMNAGGKATHGCEALTSLPLPRDLILAVLHCLDASNLARVAATCTELGVHTESALRERAAFGRIYPDSIPRGFSTWAAHLAWLEWITLRLMADEVHVRFSAVRDFERLEPATLAYYAEGIAHALEDSHARVRGMALRTLEVLQPAALEQHVDAVIRRLGDSDGYVRSSAVWTMRGLGQVALAHRASAIVQMLEDDDTDVRRAAVAALGRLEPTGFAQHASAVAHKLTHTNFCVRIAALDTLSVQPVALTQNAVTIVQMLEDAVAPVRRMAVETLSELSTAELAQHATEVAHMLEHGHEHVRYVALQTLCKMGSAAIASNVKAIVKRLADDDCNVRRAAVDTMAKLDRVELERHAAA